MTARTKRCSGSRVTWSQQSPQRPSSGLAGLQCFCFLKTKDHFSSSWASWVEGGKGHKFIVAVAGVLTSSQGIAGYGVFIDAGQPSRLASTAAILEVLQDVDGLLV